VRRRRIKARLSRADVYLFSPSVRAGLHRLQPMRVQREQNASDTRAKRGPNAKNNARITRTNAGGWHSLQPVRAAYAFYFRELLPNRERNSENYHPVLVSNQFHILDCIGQEPYQGTTCLDSLLFSSPWVKGLLHNVSVVPPKFANDNLWNPEALPPVRRASARPAPPVRAGTLHLCSTSAQDGDRLQRRPPPERG
jgi:hypothetical protein